MIDFIKNKSDYEKCKSKFSNLFVEKIAIENNPFKDNFIFFLAFEFDFIYDDCFFNSIKKFLKKIENETLFFYTINPSPEKYYYNYFKKYSVLQITVKNTYEELNEIMMKNPGDSTADAIAINSNDIAWFSTSNDWAIIASRELEIAIVGFTNKEVNNLFLSCFNENINIFNSIQEQINILDEILEFNHSLSNIYKSFIENYPSKSKIKSQK